MRIFYNTRICEISCEAQIKLIGRLGRYRPAWQAGCMPGFRSSFLSLFQNAKIRVPRTIPLKESVRTKREGIPITNPVTQQTIPKNTIARPENGIITSYLEGFIAKMIKNAPIIVHMAEARRAT